MRSCSPKTDDNWIRNLILCTLSFSLSLCHQDVLFRARSPGFLWGWKAQVCPSWNNGHEQLFTETIRRFALFALSSVLVFKRKSSHPEPWCANLVKVLKSSIALVLGILCEDQHELKGANKITSCSELHQRAANNARHCGTKNLCGKSDRRANFIDNRIFQMRGVSTFAAQCVPVTLDSIVRCALVNYYFVLAVCFGQCIFLCASVCYEKCLSLAPLHIRLVFVCSSVFCHLRAVRLHFWLHCLDVDVFRAVFDSVSSAIVHKL